MSRRLNREVRDWLDAQRDGSDEVAEQALRRAFAELGRRRPSPGFADRVLLRAGRLAPASPWRRGWLRAAVAACLVGAGLSLAALPVAWAVVNPLLHALGSPLVATVSHAGGRWLAASLALGGVAADIGAAVGALLVTPAALLLLTANLLLALASLLGLKRLLKAPEELMPW